MAKNIVKDNRRAKLPLVSVVMSVYNCEKYVGEAIESILDQTFTDFEFIVVNDGSTDNTLKIIREYKDPRIVLISRENKGLVASLNEGVAVARGKYIARMDGDDISRRDRFEKQVNFLNSNSDYALVGGQISLIDSNGKDMSRSIPKPLDARDIYILLGHGSIIAHPTVMMRKSQVFRIGLYRPEAWPAEDYDLWQRLARQSKLGNLAENVLRYRILDTGISMSATEAQARITQDLARLWRTEVLSVFTAVNPSKVASMVYRYKKAAKVIPGYTLKGYLVPLLESYRKDTELKRAPVLRRLICLYLDIVRHLVARYG